MTGLHGRWHLALSPSRRWRLCRLHLGVADAPGCMFIISDCPGRGGGGGVAGGGGGEEEEEGADDRLWSLGRSHEDKARLAHGVYEEPPSLSCQCWGLNIKATYHTVEVHADQRMAMVWYDWQQMVPEEDLSVRGCAGYLHRHHLHWLLHLKQRMATPLEADVPAAQKQVSGHGLSSPAPFLVCLIYCSSLT